MGLTQVGAKGLTLVGAMDLTPVGATALTIVGAMGLTPVGAKELLVGARLWGKPSGLPARTRRVRAIQAQ